MNKKLVAAFCCLLLLALLPAGCGFQPSPADLVVTMTPQELSGEAAMLWQAFSTDAGSPLWTRGMNNFVDVYNYRATGAAAAEGQQLSLDVWLRTADGWQNALGVDLPVQQEDKILLLNYDGRFWGVVESLMNGASGYVDGGEIDALSPLSYDERGAWPWKWAEEFQLTPGGEFLLRAAGPTESISENEESAPAFNSERWREDLTVEGCVALTITLKV